MEGEVVLETCDEFSLGRSPRLTFPDFVVDLYLHQQRLESIFELLGSRENDLTFSFGWALARCPSLLAQLVAHVLQDAVSVESVTVQLQEPHSAGGYTDIEIVSSQFHIIIEAKRGWALPSKAQLELYASRLKASHAPLRALVTCSDSSREYAGLYLPASVRGFPLQHLRWREVRALALGAKGSHAERRLARELGAYLGSVIMAQSRTSNMVFVVSLGADTPAWSTLSWRDVVERRQRYFHPVGDGWPKEPPNYIGFRYNGRLQGVHHVEGSVIVHDLHDAFREAKAGAVTGAHFVHTLGPRIAPPHEVKLGKLHPSGRYYAEIDLLLTSSTVQEAVTATKRRQAT
jgi:hypothetical protein